MPATPALPVRRKRNLKPVPMPTQKNRVFGDDVPMGWKDAAVEAGIPPRTFWRLLERREIAKVMVAGRAKVRPSAIREYMAKQEVAAI